jgi:lysophospholipase L1-like esterase
MKTVEYLDAVKKKLGIESDYGLQKPLNVTKQTVSRYRTGNGTFDQVVALRVAAILALPPAKVIADIELERATLPELQDVWRDIAKKVAVLLLGVSAGGAFVTPGSADASTLHNRNSGGDLTMSGPEYTLRRFARWLAALFAVAALAGCAAVRHGLENQNVQTPMVDVADVRALFAGDSITANWSTAARARNAGVSGETTSMIGARFAQEITRGAPRYVHILAGTNDLRPDISPVYSQGATVANIAGMASAARARNLPTIVGTVPPLDLALFPTRAPLVAPLNQAIIAAVKPLGAFIADYYSAMVLPSGQQNAALFADGIHPNASGYDVMQRVLRATKREMWRTTKTPEERAAWRAKRNGAKS